VVSSVYSLGVAETAPEPLSESYPAVADSVPEARNAVAAFAASAGADSELVDAARLATSEAVTNAVVHAYRRRRSGHIHVASWLVGEELWVLVADDGSGLRPRVDSPGLGLGLSLIAQLCDGLAVVKRANGGTELRMRFDVEHQSRGSVSSAIRPASRSFSTIR
jgi:anti-sigma regulatory factor (Ser/Thr protein kinase)